MPTAYIETTIPSYYVASASSSLFQVSKLAATRKWWDGGYSGLDLVTSLITLDEAGKGDARLADERLRLLEPIHLLHLSDEALELARLLLELGIVPAKAAPDSLHIAVASFHRIDYLVTWNFKHIANPFLRDRLRNAEERAGFELPVMCSPEELLQNDEDDR
jgi:hypothetical protein